MNLDIPNPLLIFHFNDESTQTETVFSNPVRIITAYDLQDVIPAITKIEQAIQEGYYAAGFISYEAAPAFDKAFTVRGEPKLPLVWFGVFDKPSEKPQSAMSNLKPLQRYRFSPWEPSSTKDIYEGHISDIKNAISRGETYQVNYTLRFHSNFDGDDLAFYNERLSAHPAKYAAYLNIPGYRIISFSPELFFCIQGNQITTRPMKGTARRGRWAVEDEENAAWLSNSKKNQAENVMIVDLLRNDLGRIAKTGSVTVHDLFQIERYQSVLQMTSTIGATVKEDTSLADILTALFPCGSITGAPKVSTMKMISELEDSPREIYCGTIGYIKPNKDAVFNVAIRTLFLDTETNQATYGVGGGITFDSAANSEYEEVLMKTAVLSDEYPSFQLLETMKLEGGQYVLLEKHLKRLATSANYFDIPIDMSAVKKALHDYKLLYPDMPLRVRLLISQTGAIHIESSLLDISSVKSGMVTVADSPINRSNRFFYHKTTNRAIYEYHRAKHPGTFDTLLWNEQNQITEFTTGNIVLEINGRKLTPKITCGLLPGTMRAHLLDKGEISEAVLMLQDLKRADKIWYINSVRGWIPVWLEPDCL